MSREVKRLTRPVSTYAVPDIIFLASSVALSFMPPCIRII